MADPPILFDLKQFATNQVESGSHLKNVLEDTIPCTEVLNRLPFLKN
jgi:hypothetical protein